MTPDLSGHRTEGRQMLVKQASAAPFLLAESRWGAFSRPKGDGFVQRLAKSVIFASKTRH
jgi:hypothetical protein